MSESIQGQGGVFNAGDNDGTSTTANIDPTYPTTPPNPVPAGTSTNTAVQNPTNAGSGFASPYVNSLIWGNASWSTNSGPITYWLGSGSDTNRPGGTLANWSTEQAAAVTNSLANYAAVANVTFAPAASEASANMVFFQIQTAGSTLAFAEIPNGQGGHGGNRNQVWLQFGYNQTASWSQIQQGGDGYQTVLHEIGHSMGLAHPHDGGDQNDASNFPGVTNASDIGDFGLNQGPFTAMSYNTGYNLQPNTTQAFGENATLGALDIAALQQIYGANNTYRTGNDTYALPTANQVGTFWSSIWDAGGTDTISAAGATAAATIDLRAATLTGQNAGGYISRVAGIQGGMTIANGVTIENAVGGSAADTIIGNGADNVLTGGASADTITGGAGNDVLRDTATNLDGDVFTDFTNADVVNVTDAGGSVTNLSFSNNTLSFTTASGNHTVQLRGGAMTGTVQQRADTTGGGGVDIFFADATTPPPATAPVYSIAVNPGSGAEGTATGTGQVFTYTVTRSSAAAAATIAVGLSGTATGPGQTNADYATSLQNGTLSFAAGATTATFTVTTVPDSVIEGDETVVATLGTSTDNGTLGTASATAIILNDDSAAPTPTPTPSPTPTPVPAGVAQTGTAGPDLITGGTGADTLQGLAGNDTVSGREGNDLILGNQGDDLLSGNQGRDTLFGGQGQDTLFGGQDADVLFGNLGNDVMLGNLGNDTLYGGQGADSLYGGQGDDVLFGDLGNDVLYGDLGNDVLVGGAGADRYVFGQNSGADVVLGFSAAEGDRLDLRGQTYTFGRAADGSGSALLVLSGGGTIELAGITQAQVNASFFA